ncbi:MAG: histidine kinase [Bacteroidales bacterium]|nr:histidine kinase [Bacteroidales bacterium]
MVNPVIRRRTYASIYFTAWGIIALAHFLLGLLFSEHPIIISVTESIILSFLFAVIGVAIWYPVYYTDPEKNRVLNFITNHLASCFLSVALWIWFGNVIMEWIFSDNNQYISDYEDALAWRLAIGMLYYTLVSTNYYLIIYYDSFKEKVTRESQLKALVKESELKSLKSQINPHFLFNSLNSISSLTMFSPERAQEMVINLSDFLRYSLSQKKETLTSFENELENIDRYLKIEKTRFGKRLEVKREVNDECLNLKLPGLILQPIMENAIKYGVYESTDQSNISIESKCKPNLLTVIIKNDYDPEFIASRGEGIGLRNVKSRLEILYSRNDLLKIKKDDKTFEVILQFPQN